MDSLLDTEGKLKDALAKAARELKGLSSERDQLKLHLQESNARYQEEYAARRRAERKQGKLLSFSSKDAEELRQEIIALQAQLSDSRTSEHQIEALRAEIAALTADLKTHQERLASAQIDLTRESEQRMKAEYHCKALELELRTDGQVRSAAASAVCASGPLPLNTSLDTVHTQMAAAVSAGSSGDLISRAEHHHILGLKLSSMQQEMLREFQQRVEVLEQDWRMRLNAESTELDALRATQIQQAEARLQMELMKSAEASKDCSQLRAWLQEAKAANQTLAVRADEADQQASQLRKQLISHASQVDEVARGLSWECTQFGHVLAKLRELASDLPGTPRRLYLFTDVEEQLKNMESRMQSLQTVLGAGEANSRADTVSGQDSHIATRTIHSMKDLDDMIGDMRKAPISISSLTSPRRQEADSSGRLEELKLLNSQLQARIDSVEAELRKAKSELGRVQQEKDRMQEENDDMQSKLGTRETRARNLEEKQRSLQAKCENMESHCSQLERKASERLEEVRRLQEELSTMFQSKIDLQQQMDTMEQNNQILQQQLQQLSSGKDVLGSEHSKVLEEIKNLEEYKVKIAEAAKSWDEERAKLHEEIRELSGTISLQAARLAELETLQSKVEELQATSSDSQHVSKQLTDTRDALLAELERQGREVQDAQERLVQAQQYIARLEERSALSDQRADVIQAETVAVLRMALKQLQGLLSNSLSGLRICQDAIKQSFQTETQQALHTCQQLLKKAHERFAQVQAETEGSLRQELNLVNEQCKKSDESVAQLQTQLQALQTEHTEALSTLQQLTRSHFPSCHTSHPTSSHKPDADIHANEQPSNLKEVVAAVKVGVERLTLEFNQEQRARSGLTVERQRLSEELSVLAGMRDALVSALAHELSLPMGLQQELRSHDRAAFQHGLQELCEVVWRQGQVAGFCTAMGTESKILQQQLAEREDVIKTLEQRLDAASKAYKRSLQHWKSTCMASANKAFQQGLKPLYEEIACIRASVSDLSNLHDTDMDELHHGADTVLKDQRSLALKALTEMEGVALTLQAALGGQLEKAEQLAERVAELQADKDRQAQVEQRRIQRQAEEVDSLTDRIRALEAREIEKDGQLKQLRRSNMQRQRSLIDSQASMERSRESSDLQTPRNSFTSDENAPPRTISPPQSLQISGGPVKANRSGSDYGRKDW